MKNIINSESLTQFKNRIELGMGLLQEQQIPVNVYTFGFIVQELNKYILDDEHPRYTAFVNGKFNEGVMELSVFIADRFYQQDWIDLMTFTYPKGSTIAVSVTPTKSFKDIVPPVPAARKSIVPVPIVENFDADVQTMNINRSGGGGSRKGIKRNHKFKYTTYTEYVNFVSVLFDEFAGCTDCLNKSIIAGFLGNFSYPEAFISNGRLSRQHLQLKPDIELNEDVKKKFQIDWSYFIDKWSTNAIFLAQYKTADTVRTYTKRHSSIDLIEQRIGLNQFTLTDFGKVIWGYIHELLGYMEPDSSNVEETTEEVEEEHKQDTGFDVLPTTTNLINRVGKEEQLEKHIEEKVQEEPSKVRKMGFDKCNGCCHFDQDMMWCDKRQGYINTLEHEECFDDAKPELKVAPVEEVEKICFNCKRWHSGNNPGNLKAIACRCPVHGKKTLTDHTCNKFVAIVKKES